MAKQFTREQFLRNLGDSGLFTPQEIEATLRVQPLSREDGTAFAQRLIAAGKLTLFQSEAVSERRFDELVIGNYLVLDRLGAGGMGTVYKARHRRMKRVVAIKVLSRDVAKSERFVQRFQREVEAVARLSHPNIVMAHDADEAEVGHFLVMEFVNGRDLASEVQERGPLPVAEAVEYTVQAARALAYAHEQGIIHRDIKPANLLRDSSGVVKVADLGLARFNEAVGAEKASALTQAGTIMGTVDFMPPEQALGLTSIDHRADIYSLGCTLYFLLTGQPPYQGETLMATLLQHRDAPIPLLTAARGDVPAALDPIFQRLVAKKPDERFASMTDVIHALEPLALAAPAPPQPPVSPLTRQVPASSATVDLAPANQDTGMGEVIGPTVNFRTAPTPAPAAPAVLLVEPSRSQAVIIRGYLQKIGFADIPTAPSGQKALEVARATPPQVVLSSLHLPDMTGVQLAQQMRAESALAAVGFVLITSQDDAQAANLQSPGGNIICLHKPFDQEHLAKALAAATSAAPPARDRMRVLIVDDSAAARVHIRAVLMGLGLRSFAEAVDGAEGIAELEKETFDLVVTDYTMPRLDGRGLIDFIRHRSAQPSVPVIMVTTETDPAKLEAVRRLGVQAIFDKAFRPEVVRGVLEKLR